MTGVPAQSIQPPAVPAHFQTFLAFDFGLKRTGVASGNRMLKSATPQRTIQAEGDARFVQVAQRIKEWQPDALVMDVMMPKVDGITATERIREQPGNDDCVVIVVSAEPAAEERARAIGSDDFVAKPFDPDDLSARTRAALRWRSGQAV